MGKRSTINHKNGKLTQDARKKKQEEIDRLRKCHSKSEFEKIMVKSDRSISGDQWRGHRNKYR